ncbi:MAG: DUF3307 domain-containing protein [Cognaticolwellia sp.]
MELLLLMLTAHFVGDFYLQPVHGLKKNDSKKIRKLWPHFLMYTLLYVIVFLIADLSILSIAIATAAISLSHLLSVYWKYYRENNLRYFLIDQSMQFSIIIIIWAYLANITIAQSIAFIEQILTAKNMIITISYLLVCKPASVIISLALKKHTDNLANTSTENPASTTDNKNENMGLLSAGAWIGYIERCLAISFIFMGQFSGIGFLVATKTIFRFGDLTKNKDMKLTEYMMLGTLLSYAIALFIGWNAMQLYYAI